MNPAIFVSFRQVDGLNFTGAYDMLTMVIADLYNKHLYLLDGIRQKVVPSIEKKGFAAVSSFLFSQHFVVHLEDTMWCILGIKSSSPKAESNRISSAKTAGYFSLCAGVTRRFFAVPLRSDENR